MAVGAALSTDLIIHGGTYSVKGLAEIVGGVYDCGMDEITAAMAAKLLGVTRQRVCRMAQAGGLPGRLVTGPPGSGIASYYLFRRADVEALAQERAARAAGTGEQKRGPRPKTPSESEP